MGMKHASKNNWLKNASTKIDYYKCMSGSYDLKQIPKNVSTEIDYCKCIFGSYELKQISRKCFSFYYSIPRNQTGYNKYNQLCCVEFAIHPY